MVRLERLEYGKFCETRKGRIEKKAEHRLLGWSADFPADLVEMCTPARIGISSDAFCFDDSSPDAPTHGTVLRPVVSEAERRRVLPLLCRVRMRPEDGEGGRERRYTTARYIVDPAGDAGPRELLGAMSDPLLQGVTRDDVTPQLSSLSAPAPAEPESEPEPAGDARLFVQGALAYILSGVPVAITDFAPEEFSEDEFFGWVAALWHLLPRPLRPYLSAGWAVGGQLSGRLMVTYATRRAETCAVYSHKSRKWTRPSRGEWEREGGADSFNRFLRPGRAYARHVLEVGRSALDGDQYLAAHLGRVQLRQLPDMHEPLLVSALRVPGDRILDARRLHDWRHALAGEANVAPPRPDSRKFIFDDNALEAFLSSLSSLEDEEARPIADRGLWSFVTSWDATLYAKSLAASDAAWAPRARLLASIARTGASGALLALYEAAELEQAEALPPEVASALAASLNSDASFTEDAAVGLHACLLAAKTLPGAYVAWLRTAAGGRANDFRLALALLADGRPEAWPAAVRIGDLTASAAVKALCRYDLRQEATAADARALEGVDEPNLGAFFAVLYAGWHGEPDGGLADGRELLLSWLRALPRDFVASWLRAVRVGQAIGNLPPSLLNEPVSPLLLIEFGEKLPPDAVNDIAAEVERGGVPVSLLDVVADLTLKRWYVLGRQVEQKCGPQSPWAQVVAQWPDEFTEALLLPPQKRPTGQAALDIPPEDVRMDSNQAERLIEVWHTKEYHRRLNADVAHLLWVWAAHALDAHRLNARLADICRGVEKEKSLPRLEPPTERDLDTAVSLARTAGVHLRLAEGARALWAKARYPWHFRLLLGIFEEINFEATIPQVEKLVPHRAWLTRHLEQGGDVHPEREKRFRLAMAEFHEIPFPGRGDLEFREEYAWGKSALWAAYKGVPIDRQGPLNSALELYGGDTPERSGLCRRYLAEYKGTPAHNHALKRVLRDYLLPLLRRNYNLSEVEMIFGLGREDGYGPGISITQRWRRPLDQNSESLLSEVMKSERKVIESALRALYPRATT